MEYRQLGKHGIRVSEICLGSWLTYGGATAEDTAGQCIKQAYDLGINFFDTANVYAEGEAEKIVGKVLRQYPRESYVLATKVYFRMGNGPNDHGLSRKHILEQCDASLKRLGLDYIDLYQAHRYDSTVPLAETLMAFDHLVKQGKILYYGVSQWSAGQLAHATDLTRLANLAPIVSDQPRYNMLDRMIEKEVLPLCRREGIGIINYSPLAQGLLTGKYKPGQSLPQDSRASDPKQNMFLNNGELDQQQLLKVQRLLPIAEQEGLSLSQLALTWCLRNPEISSVIIGASKPAQVQENANASGKQLSWATIQRIEEVLEMEISDRATVGA
ncbi:aldo/keto reductase family protein [Nostoc sp. FACHB-892]|uniref:aldo/keto reductase family protein n=1 Tax=Nostoc sp. FACHB-892 TaxID=2692843 RepID=UPI001688DB97|nr:aldo/keto reductase family protein [Nostoc sp. FACHB-892]MBD2730518.1 aldo/keto reductase family protein [Nostoc sp. FACHB-892]